MTSARSSQLGSDRDRLARVTKLRQGGLVAVPELIREFIAPTWTVRRAVVDALANAEPAVMPVLCETLRASRENEAQIAGLIDALAATRADIDDLVLGLTDDSNAAVVCDAAQILGRRESTRAVPKLKALTRHEDDNVALAAVEALGRIGSREALEPLLELAETRNFFRTFPTIDILGRSRDSRALPTLLKVAADPLYATEALRALGRLGDPAAVPVLLEHLSRASGSLVCTIAVALLAIHDTAEQRFGTGTTIERILLASPNVADARRQLTLALRRADPSEQLAIGRVLSWIGEEGTIPTLLGLLRAAPAVAQVAAASLKKLGTVAEPFLLDAVHEGTSEERRLLVPILSGRQAARDELVACLTDEDSTVRALSCDALARSSDASVAPAIFPLLGDPDARVGQAALAAIQSLGSDETRRLALEAARSDDPRVRRAGLRIIGYFGYSEGLDILIEATQADDEKVREAAISGLPYIEGPTALRVLLEAARYESARTRTAAVRALGHTSGEPSVRERLREALGDSDAWVRYYACQALGRLQDDSATDLIAALLSDNSGQVRVAAVEALAHLRGARAFDALSNVLSSSDADLYRAALVALGISRKRQALPKLLTALDSSEAATRLVALSALSELGLAEALPAIAAGTRDSDEGVRAAAHGFLAARSDPEATTELLSLLSKEPASEAFIQALARP
ncbi:MAG TPA: HEAT repeat domain-containing protein, partial [Polyangiaceae bacterium]|nr:HEAT repeat domain-containing protein [Polyangiaceae bacterium]